jgi:DNA-binding transcriptional LysR family regulator
VRRAIAAGEADFGIFLEPQSYRDLTVRAFVEVVLGFITPPDHEFSGLGSCRFSRCAGLSLILPAAPLAVSQQIAILEGVSGVALDRTVTCDNIQMITSLVLEGAGIGILTSIDASTEEGRGQLAFTRITDSVLRPMTLALCTASARTLSHAAEVVMGEIEAGFAALGYPASTGAAPDQA